MTLSEHTISRRSAVAAGLGIFASLGLAVAASLETAGSAPASSSSTDEQVDETVQIDADAYDQLIDSIPAADDAKIAASTWATKVKDAGVLRVGGVQTFHAVQLAQREVTAVARLRRRLERRCRLPLAKMGDAAKIEDTQVTSDTRESVLQNDQVDVVFATYSINDDRKKVISFAGPYYTTQQSILVMADNKDINSVDDLAGKNVAAQSGSTGPAILEEFAPKATVQEFKTDEEARTALSQGRVDAYVIDTNMLLGSMVRQPGKYRLAGDPFGPVDAYGIGLPLDSDGVAFVNEFLQKIEDEGMWADLWQVCIGDRAGIDDVPEPPAIGA